MTSPEKRSGKIRNSEASGLGVPDKGLLENPFGLRPHKAIVRLSDIDAYVGSAGRNGNVRQDQRFPCPGDHFLGRFEYALRKSWKRLVLPPKRSEEHTSELQSLMRISYAVFCLKKKRIQ